MRDEQFKTAVKLLAESVPLAANQLAEADEEWKAGQDDEDALNMGEILIRRGLVSAEQWAESWAKAGLILDLRGPGGNKTLMVGLIVLAVVAVIVLAVMMAG